MAHGMYEGNEKSTNDRMVNLRRNILHGGFSFSYALAPSLARKAALKMFFKPTPYGLPPEAEKWLAGGAGFQLEVAGQKVQAWRWGTGPATLLVHGWNGLGGHFNYLAAALVQAGHSVVTFDFPAHGASQGEVGSYFIFCETMRRFLDPKSGFGIDKLVAHSLGAAAAINAMAHQNVSPRTVLLAPAFYIRRIVEGAFDLYGLPAKIYRQLIHEFEVQFGYVFDQAEPHVLLPKVKAPLFVIHDQNDRTIPFAGTEALAKRHGNLVLAATSGLGHKRILRDPRVRDMILERFGE